MTKCKLCATNHRFGMPATGSSNTIHGNTWCAERCVWGTRLNSLRRRRDVSDRRRTLDDRSRRRPASQGLTPPRGQTMIGVSRAHPGSTCPSRLIQSTTTLRHASPFRLASTAWILLSGTQRQCKATAGLFPSASGQCRTCPAGKYQEGGMDGCNPCPSGKFSHLRERGTVQCPGGLVSDPQATSCKACCSVGRYREKDVCHDCAAGFYGQTGVLDADSCPVCPGEV